MNRFPIKAAILVSSFFWHATVYAAEPGFYIGAGLGAVEQDFDDDKGILVAIQSPFGGGAAFTVFPDRVDVEEDDFAWNAILGYRINTYLAAELAYSDFGHTDVLEVYTFEDTGLPFFPGELRRNFTATVSGPSLSVLGLLPIGSRFEVFARIGVLFADEKIELQYTSGSNSDTFGSELWLGGLGLNLSITDRWSARLEHQQTGTMGSNIYTGETDLEQTSLTVLFKL